MVCEVLLLADFIFAICTLFEDPASFKFWFLSVTLQLLSLFSSTLWDNSEVGTEKFMGMGCYGDLT